MRMDQQVKVIHTQLGFRNGHSRKRILVSDVPDARGVFGDALFTVFEQNEFSKYGLNDPQQVPFTYRASLKRVHTDFGPWLVGDFSHIAATGVYQAYCGNARGPSFAIRDDVWCRLLPDCIRFFQVMSCGRRAVGWHEACHLDDGYIREEDRYIEAAGGWHDAGDFRKWATSTALNAIALLIGHRLWGGREADLGLAEGCFLEEAMQGVHYFLNIQDPDTGALLQNIGGGRDVPHDNLDCRYTDNRPRSGDERRIWPGRNATPPGKFTTLYALYANALKARDPELSARCLAAARASQRCDRTTGLPDADHLQWRAWGGLELWRCTAAEEDRADALAALGGLLDLQVRTFIGGQSLTRGFFRAGPGQHAFHHKHIGAAYPIWVIAAFLDAFPGHPAAGRWRDAISLWVDDYALVFAARNPFGLLPYALYTAPPQEHPHHHYRPLGEGLCFRYFITGKMGTNARSSLDAAALAAAARVLGRPELVTHAYRLLDWTLGNNPFQLSTMNGIGVIQPSALSFQMGNIPGGVTMGIFGDEADQPWYPHPWACTDEYYGYQTSQFLWAVLALQDLPCA